MGGQKGKRKGGNAGVGVDFKKVKHKVGKKLPKAQNDTRTDFQAKAIHLPSQSLAADKGAAVVSERNLTTTELLIQTAHHSERVRKDALQGLQQLLSDHPAEARRHAAALLERAAARLSDGDGGVRDALLAMLRGAALPALGPAVLAPFLPMLMAHLEAAMTHLEGAVRLDALRALEALSEASPASFAPPASGLLAPVLCHFATLLSPAHRGRSVKAQALAGLARVVASLRRFLEAVLPDRPADAGSGGGGGSRAGGEGDAAAAVAPLMAHRCEWAPRPEALGPAQLLAIYTAPVPGQRAQHGQQAQAQAQLQKRPPQQQQQQPKPPKAVSKKRKLHIEPGTAQDELGPPAKAAPGPGPAAPPAAAAAAAAAAAPAVLRGAGLAAAQEAALQVIAALASCWRECAPATLSTAPEQEAAQALVDILRCASALLRGLSMLPGDPGLAADGAGAGAARRAELAGAAAAALLPALVPSFPATAPGARPTAAVAELVASFNVCGAQLLGSFMAAGVAWPARPERAAPVELVWCGTLLRYIQGVLLTGTAVPPADALTAELQPSEGGAAAAAGAAAVVLPLLRTVDRLLPRLAPSDRAALLSGVGALAAARQSGGGRGQSGGGAVRDACLRLQRDLLLRHLRDGGGDAAAAADMAAWLRAAPKALWGLGDRAPGCSEALLSMLYHAARLAPPGSPLLEALAEAQPQIAPLLATALPPQPAAAGGGGGGGGASGTSGKKASKQHKQQQQQQQGGPSGGGSGSSGGGGGAMPVLVGPLSRLPPRARDTGADLISLLSPLQPALVRSVALAVRLTAYPDSFVERLLDGVLSNARGAMGAESYLQLLATLLCPPAGAPLVAAGGGGGGPAGGRKQQRGGGGTSGGPAAGGGTADGEGAGPRRLDAGYERHLVVADCVCRWLQRYGPPAELAGLLADCLCDQWGEHTAHREAARRAQAQGPAAAEAVAAADEGVRCVAYSLVSVCAAALGTWSPQRLAGAAAAGAAAGAQQAAEGDGGPPLPPRLEASLPEALAELLHAAASEAAARTSEAAADGEQGAAAGAAAGDGAALAAGAAAAAAVGRWFAALLLEPAPRLALPFLDAAASRALGGGGGTGGTGSGAATAAADALSLAAAAEAAHAALTARPLQPWWLALEAPARALSGRLAGAAAALQEVSGDARCVARCERLSAAMEGLFAR
ncbi:hypothetical protein Rsub_05974 [Raphidocelis subcapitata]|uniref:Pre-rRNA-processing protein Ipi1 N-terminal domain-containing protein n=1 Tax=Raphidocelis subcapitata TaxID=307507 RepID=A0A2V0P2W8_9CHLO|nr:hypothetical protein Rsub_05974 [Raphidocelis subcapitata]|eukprot:GBF93242.1 hypothetical protein Rsub_05974 [Raphidocelis subcapitata]